MWRRLEGGRGAAAEETGKVSYLSPEGKGLAGCGRKEKPCFRLPALATLQPFLAPPSSEFSPRPWITAPLMGFCFPGLSWLEDTREQKGSAHPLEKQ